MGDIIHFTPKYNAHKMETVRASFMDRLSEEVLSNDKRIDMPPTVVAQLIRRGYSDASKGLMFPVIEFANDFKIDVIVTNFPNDSKTLKGYLSLYANRLNIPPRIVVSDSESYGHQRWTVAHEIWHFLMHAKDNRTETVYYPEDSLNYDLDDSSEEACANAFATELLMPEQMFRFVYRKSSFWNRKRKLSSMFMVSPKAIKRRIRELNL